MIKRALKIFVIGLCTFFALSIGSVLIYRFIPVPYTPLMFYKTATSFFDDEVIGIDKKWVSLDQIAKPMQHAVIRAEDAKFYQHNGFDFEAIEKAMKYNKTHKKQKGASTISQQTAKNVFLWPARSWIRKGMEAYFTVLIELLWPKHRILEVYLNVIELGPGVYGVEAASLRYFHKKAKSLNTNQAALMAAVLPNPIRFKINKPSSYILRRQRKIMGHTAAPVVTAKPEPIENKDFFDIKFDEDDDTENGAGATEAAPAND